MKSITQQGSSLEKAIKSAWERAEKPKKFVIVIFEEPSYNFLGINTHPAKIGLFFEVEQLIEHSVITPSQKTIKHNSSSQRMPSIPLQAPLDESQERVEKIVKESIPSKSSMLATDREIWTQEMIQASEEWLKQVLNHINMSHQVFSIHALQYDLRIVFEKPLFEQIEPQQQLFRSLCLLLLQTLRQKFHRPLRGFRIIINSTHGQQ